MTPEHMRMILALKVIAATAQKLATDLEQGRLWPDQICDAVKTLENAMRDVK